jgi:hypothetical protein
LVECLAPGDHPDLPLHNFESLFEAQATSVSVEDNLSPSKLALIVSGVVALFILVSGLCVYACRRSRAHKIHAEDDDLMKLGEGTLQDMVDSVMLHSDTLSENTDTPEAAPAAEGKPSVRRSPKKVVGAQRNSVGIVRVDTETDLV